MAKKEEWEIIVDAIRAEEAADREAEATEKTRARRCMVLVRALDDYFKSSAADQWDAVRRIYQNLRKDGVI